MPRRPHAYAREYAGHNYHAVDFFEADDTFRSSDHDPIKVGRNLTVDDPRPKTRPPHRPRAARA